jgi:phenylalanyl-tRNA synthetase beta chain
MADALLAQGYQEVVTYSFVDESWERDLMGNANPIRLKNPIASNLSVMRSGLWAGLLDVLTYNLNRKQERAMLFEIGATYAATTLGYLETTEIAALFYGAHLPEQWGSTARDVDFYDVKAHVDTLTHGQAEYRVETHVALHPGQSSRIYLHNKPIGWLGKLHPKWQQQHHLVKNTYLFALEVDAIANVVVPRYEEVPKFLAVRRDVAIVVDSKVPVQAILDTIKDAQISLVSQVQLFDTYQGKGIEDSKKSLALSVLMQDTHRTLLDTEVEQAVAELLQLLEKQFSAVLRN